MHCGGPNTRHFRGRIHIDEIDAWGLEWGLGVLVHSVQRAVSIGYETWTLVKGDWRARP